MPGFDLTRSRFLYGTTLTDSSTLPVASESGSLNWCGVVNKTATGKYEVYFWVEDDKDYKSEVWTFTIEIK